MSRAKTKVPPHVRVVDQGVPPDRNGRRVCRCGLPEDHPSHTMPDPVPDPRPGYG